MCTPAIRLTANITTRKLENDWRRVGSRWRTRRAWQEGVTSSLNAARYEEAEIGNTHPQRGDTQETP